MGTITGVPKTYKPVTTMGALTNEVNPKPLVEEKILVKVTLTANNAITCIVSGEISNKQLKQLFHDILEDRKKQNKRN